MYALIRPKSAKYENRLIAITPGIRGEESGKTSLAIEVVKIRSIKAKFVNLQGEEVYFSGNKN